VERYDNATAVMGKYQPPLNMVPDVAEENSLPREKDLPCCLSIAREKEIASHLAFLSGTLDDSLKVMAVCVEERADGRVATIPLNIGDLAKVTVGLSMLAMTLEQAARRGQYVPRLNLMAG